MHKAKGAWNMLKAVCEFNEILSVSHWVVHKYIVGKYDIVICRAQSFISFKKFSIKTYGAPILQLADQFQYTR